LRSEVDEHLEELSRLLETAGGREVGRVLVERARPDASTFIGRGRVEALRDDLRDLRADLVVFDDDLSPAQAHKIEEAVGVRVIDRSALILDIFGRRARTREARTQIELAQLRYLLPRLTRRWTHFSRQVGGIGVRGVGETQLEIDRRLVRRRIARLQSELKRIDRARGERRKRRKATFQAALVGYTNSGKSTLLNALTGAGAFAEDRLFATLDPLVRRLSRSGPRPILLIDTVGFVRKLPHDLVASFRSTLHEASAADLLLHVIDLSHHDHEAQAETTRRVLADLGLSDRPLVEVFNKIDRLDGSGAMDRAARLDPGARFVSALTGEGVEELRAGVQRAASSNGDFAADRRSVGQRDESPETEAQVDGDAAPRDGGRQE